MTIKQLERLGIIHYESKIKPRLFFIPRVGDKIIPEKAQMDYIFDLIYEAGFDEGIKRGEKNKVNQFKELLNIETNDKTL